MFVISPGERYDILVDFSRYQPGTRVVLRNNIGAGDTAYVMRFDIARSAARRRPHPRTLTEAPPHPRAPKAPPTAISASSSARTAFAASG